MVLAQTIEFHDDVPKYYITLHPGTFPTKESFQLGLITNWFKKKGLSKRYTLEEIFRFTGEGRCFIPSHIETDGEEYSFISSNLMFVDVDDDEQVTDPKEVLKELYGVCAGLFFTSSHGMKGKGNRYRLAFVLDEYIRDERTYDYIFKALVGKLRQMGVPADESIRTPMQRVRTATKGYIISNLDAVFSVKELREEAQKQREREIQERQQKIQAATDRKDAYVYSVEELKDRAEAIGYVDSFDEWSKLGYSLKSYVNEGFIDDIDGYEIFSILCGGNDESQFWASLRATRITIGTFIYYSNQAGFKRSYKYYHAIAEATNSINVEKVKFDRYISIEFSKDLLKSERNILVKSPTGSGKTHSFINAAKELAQELLSSGQNRFFILSVPTIAITDQVASDNDVLAVRGETPDLYKRLKQYVDDGKRVLVCTYDMSEILIQLLSSIKPFASYALIIDEVHQLVHNYGFRRQAIESLYSLHSRVKSFIGLSGTPDDVLRDPFDREVHVQTKYEAAPCQVWGALTYEKRDEEEPLLFQLLKQKAEAGKRLLVFIQSKSIIKRLQMQLRKDGVKVASVTSDGKLTNPTYKTLVEESRFPNDIQVILSTSVLSDGINLRNENAKYDCILVASNNSPMFNVDQARQCANRFRNVYNGFYVFMQQSKKETKHLFNIESAYKYEKLIAQNAVDLINEQFAGRGNSALFRMARIEKRYGITFDDTEMANYNALQLRHNVSEEKAQFYTLYRNQFIEALKNVMGTAPAPSIDVSAFMKEAELDLSPVADELKALKEAAKADKAEKALNIGKYFTKTIYDAFVEGNDEMLRAFKSAVTPEHYACLNGIVHLTDYEISLHLVKRVERRADINTYKHRIEALANIQYFNRIHRQTPSKEAYETIHAYVGETLTKSEMDKILQNVTKRFKRSKTVDVKHIMNSYFYHEKIKAAKGERFTVLQELTVVHISTEHEAPTEIIYESMKLYAEKQGGKLAEIILTMGGSY